MQQEVNKELLFKEFNLQEAENRIVSTNKRNVSTNAFFDKETADLFLKNNFKLSLSDVVLNNLQVISDFLKSNLKKELEITHFNFHLLSSRPIFHFNNEAGDKIILNQSSRIEMTKNISGQDLVISFPKADFSSVNIKYGSVTLNYNNEHMSFYTNRKTSDSLNLTFTNSGTRINIETGISTNLIENLNEGINNSRIKEIVNSNIKLLKKICAHAILNINSQSDIENFNEHFKKIPITNPAEFKDRMDIYYLLNDGAIPEDKKLELDKIIEESKQQNIELTRPVR